MDFVHHTIDTGDHEPVHHYASRIPYTLREKVNDLVSDMLNDQTVKQPVG